MLSRQEKEWEQWRQARSELRRQIEALSDEMEALAKRLSVLEQTINNEEGA